MFQIKPEDVTQIIESSWEEGTGGMSEDDLVQAWLPLDEWQGSAIQEALRQEGIPCHYSTAKLASAKFPNSGGSTAIYVRRKDVQRAREFIESYDWPSYRGGT